MKSSLLATLLLVLLCSDQASAQLGRPKIVLDSPAAVDASGSDLMLEADELLWIAAWTDARDPLNPALRDVFMAVSTDGGHAWSPEFQVTAEVAAGRTVSHPRLAADQSTIYLVYCAEDPSTASSSIMFQASADQGTTWNAAMLSATGRAPVLAVEGATVVAWLDDSVSPNPLMAASTNAGTLAIPGPPAMLSPPGFDVDEDGYDAFVGPVYGPLVCVTFAAGLGSGQKDLYFTTQQGGNSTDPWSAPLAVSTSGNVQKNPIVNGFHFLWSADQVPGNLNVNDDLLFYRRYDYFTLSFGPVVPMSPSGVASSDVRSFDLDLSGQRVLVASTNKDLYVYPFGHTSVSVSGDEGLTWTSKLIRFAGATSGPTAVVSAGITKAPGYHGYQMYVMHLDGSLVPGQNTQTPAFAFSSDAGNNWYSFPFGTGYLAGESVVTGGQAWLIQDNKLGGVWKSNGGPLAADRVEFSGLDFPLVSGIYNSSTGTIRLLMFGNPVLDYNTGTRWLASTTLGVSPHPENPGLFIRLGASAMLAASIANSVGSIVRQNGASSVTIGVPPLPSGLTIYLQGFIGGAPYAREAGEVYHLRIP